MRKVLFVLVLAIIAVACFPQNQCNYQFVEYCGGMNTVPCQGHLINANEWESTSFVGSWLTYGHAMTIHVHPVDAMTGEHITGAIDHFEAFVSPTQRPNDPGNQSAPCAGNLCEWNFQPDPNGDFVFDVHNDTCAEYFVYIHVWTQPGSPVDGGSE